jgi:hypothetical protein
MSVRVHIIVAMALLLGVAGGKARAQGNNDFGEIETKYLFGFTSGTSIGLEGEKEISIDTVGRFGKRDGRYSATETKLEFEQTPTQFIQYEFGALLASHHIRSVTDLDDRNAFNFGGLFGEIRYLAIERTQSSPVAVALSLEPTWRRIDETGGERISNFELEAKVAADLELVPNRVFLAFNAFYEPEWTRTPDGEHEKESKLGLSTGLAFRVSPPVVIGAELGYFRHYEGALLNTFDGDALFLGPTFYWKFARKAFVTAAWASQITGRSVDSPGSLNLSEFSRHRAKVKLAVEF